MEATAVCASEEGFPGAVTGQHEHSVGKWGAKEVSSLISSVPLNNPDSSVLNELQTKRNSRTSQIDVYNTQQNLTKEALEKL